MTPAEPEPAQEQSFLSHLFELRERLLRAIAAVVIVWLALTPFANKLYAWLAQPLLSKLPDGSKMIAIEVAGPFFTPLKLAFFVAVFLAMPIILYQAWAFVAPGLYRHEKRLATPILISSIFLFYFGCAFAYFLVLPMVFGFLSSVAPEGVAVMPDIAHYLDFVLVMFLSFGLCFELPVATVIIVLLGWATPDQLVKSRGYVVVGCFIVAAILAPPDVISQTLLAVPMCLLYEIGVLAARLVVKRKAVESPEAN
jgi:sec-independent protein translocase protein TatC